LKPVRSAISASERRVPLSNSFTRLICTRVISSRAACDRSTLSAGFETAPRHRAVAQHIAHADSRAGVLAAEYRDLLGTAMPARRRRRAPVAREIVAGENSDRLRKGCTELFAGVREFGSLEGAGTSTSRHGRMATAR
jgi:hypothetical protein